jgi:hypothetical protein
LVSSLCENGRHAPAIDLDLPASLSRSCRGESYLTLNKVVDWGRYVAVVEAMEACGLVVTSGSWWAAVRYHRSPSAGVYRTIGKRGEIIAPSFRLIVSAELVPSSTPGHFHLYLDAELAWEDYRRLLEAMTLAGLVERGYYDISCVQQMTLLRKPGIRKSSPLGGIWRVPR